MTEPIDYSLNVTRSDALMLYATSQGGYTVRLHLRLDELIRPDAMRKALDFTAKRYPYFCVSLKWNEREAYYVRNDSPDRSFHTADSAPAPGAQLDGKPWTGTGRGERLYPEAVLPSSGAFRDQRKCVYLHDPDLS